MAAPTTYNLADVWEMAADACADRTALVVGDRRLSYAELEERSNRLAHHLVQEGVEPGDHIGVYMENGTEYIESMLAAYKIRAVAININFRYREAELEHLFNDADLVGVIFQRRFAPLIESVRDACPELSWFLAVDDGSDASTAGLGGQDYEEVLAASKAGRDFLPRSNDDPYVIYTGGTTGFPKGVVWRNEDAFFACIGAGDPMRLEGPVSEPAQLLDRIIDGSFVYLPVAPLMHAAGQWTALSWLFAGGTVVLMPGSLDAKKLWETVEAEGANVVTIVGDAVARPLVDAFDAHGPYDVSSLMSLASGGAPLTSSMSAELQRIAPNAAIVDGYGSSETGAQATKRHGGDDADDGPKFSAYANTAVLNEETLEPVTPGSGEQGRVALRGHIPQGYYKDEEKTAETFVESAGHRWVLTGDLATVDEDGGVNLLGRGSGCINTGGEKVFPEEVEAVIKADDEVYDAIVVGVADDRWGQRVSAVVSAAPGATIDPERLRGFCRDRLAGYKTPKDIVVVDRVRRSPAGKADLRWAQSVAEENA